MMRRGLLGGKEGTVKELDKGKVVVEIGGLTVPVDPWDLKKV